MDDFTAEYTYICDYIKNNYNDKLTLKNLNIVQKFYEGIPITDDMLIQDEDSPIDKPIVSTFWDGINIESDENGWIQGRTSFTVVFYMRTDNENNGLTLCKYAFEMLKLIKGINYSPTTSYKINSVTQEQPFNPIGNHIFIGFSINFTTKIIL